MSRSDWGLKLIPPTAAAVIRLLYASMRIRHHGLERIEAMNRRGGYVLALWHAQLLLMAWAAFRKPIHVVISQHRDGELIARTLARFGVIGARGSSTRGGSGALREIVRTAREGGVVAITPDGPRGPRRIAQGGVITAAQLAGVPILPVTFVSRPKKMLRSWDRFEVPLPFGRGIYVYGEPIEVPRRLDEDGAEQLRLEFESRLNELCESAERNFETLWRDAE